MKEILLQVLVAVTLVFVGAFGGMWYWYTFDYNDDKIYSWWETYPELKPLVKEILVDGKITIWERWRFDKEIDKVQKEYVNRRNKINREKLLNELKKGD